MAGQRYTQKQKDFLNEMIPGRLSSEVATLFNQKFDRKITAVRVQQYKKNYKLTSGIVTRFDKEHVPYNKGTKGLVKPNKTSFKKGNIPSNKQPVGTILMKSDGYIYKKVAETKPSRFGWKQLHRLIWEEKYGTIPEGHCLIFKNQNREDVRLENLMLITRTENVRMNKMRLFSTDASTTEAGLNVARLSNKIGELRRKKED